MPRPSLASRFAASSAAAVPAPKQMMPASLEGIEEEIGRSRRILDLPEDWDEEGAVGYSEDTWARAIQYLRRQALACWFHQGVAIPRPRIGPGPAGSIDIHWQTASYELLINVPRDESARATFYGDDYGALSIKGTFDPSAQPAGHLALVSWLTRN
jgi:hypothetical protein